MLVPAAAQLAGQHRDLIPKARLQLRNGRPLHAAGVERQTVLRRDFVDLVGHFLRVDAVAVIAVFLLKAGGLVADALQLRAVAVIAVLEFRPGQRSLIFGTSGVALQGDHISVARQGIIALALRRLDRLRVPSCVLDFGRWRFF